MLYPGALVTRGLGGPTCPLGIWAVGRDAGAGQAASTSPSPPSRKMAANFLVHEKVWFDKFKYDDAERKFYEQVNGPAAGSSHQVGAAPPASRAVSAPGGQARPTQGLCSRCWWRGLWQGAPGWLLGCWLCSCPGEGQHVHSVSLAWAGPGVTATGLRHLAAPLSFHSAHRSLHMRVPFFFEN